MDKYNIINEKFELDPNDYKYNDETKVKQIREKIAQLNLDPTIAIIPDDISTDEELNRLYNKFSLLPRKFKRFSNYYSTQLLGYNVPNMYAIMREKIIDNDYIFEGVSIANEDYSDSSIILNEKVFSTVPDLYYNKKAFDEGDINLCFVIGYSGSGKSTLTANYKDKGVEKIELDNIVCVKDHYTLEELKEISPLMYSFFSGVGAKYYISKEERKQSKELDGVFKDFMNYIKQYTKSHKNIKFIVEGIWVYLYFDDPSEFDNYAVYIKGTSFIKSKIRLIKRELSNGPKEAIKRIKEFDVYGNKYIFNTSKVDKWYDYFKSKPETLLKVENKGFVKVSESAMKELSNIDKYFVNEDAEGIINIMNHCTENENISIQEKAMIVEECKMALSDIKTYNIIDESSMVPWFTLSEGYSDISMFKDKEYTQKLVKAMREYTYLPTKENEQKVLDLGWNPNVPLTEASKNYAKERQKNWFRENNILNEGLFNKDGDKKIKDFELDGAFIHVTNYKKEYDDIYQKTFETIKKNYDNIKRKSAKLIIQDMKEYNKHEDEDSQIDIPSENDIYKCLTINSNYENKKIDHYKLSKKYPSNIGCNIKDRKGKEQDSTIVFITLKFYGEYAPSHFEIYYRYYPDKNKLEYDDYLCQY